MPAAPNYSFSCFELLLSVVQTEVVSRSFLEHLGDNVFACITIIDVGLSEIKTHFPNRSVVY